MTHGLSKGSWCRKIICLQIIRAGIMPDVKKWVGNLVIVEGHSMYDTM